MKAMIFAAGLGTRLKPLTDNCPKALIQVGGKPMLQITIEHLIKYGFNDIIINIHYLGNHITDFLKQHHHFGINIEISDESNEILETGGGLWKARHFFNDEKSFLVCNADVLTNINLEKFYQSHIQNNAMATLAVRQRNSSRYLLFDDKDILFGWENIKTHEVKIPRKIPAEIKAELADHETFPLHEHAFSGYQFISPEIFKHNKHEGKFSMIDWYLDVCRHHIIKAFHHDDDIWIDIGSPEELAKANEVVMSL
jgi:NDP-sugar pyrophosphorylase family protein